MPCSNDYLRELVKSTKHIGGLKTQRKYNLKEETYSRYIRLANQRRIIFDYDLRESEQVNILLLDIETLPMHVRVWGLYKQRIPIDNIIKEWIMLSWAAKWLYEDEVYSDILTPEECSQRSDKRICQSIWDMIDRADIIIAHNLKRFDIRKLNSRFINNGLMPPSHYRMIDTLIESRKNFAHSSHKLEYLGRLLRNEGKIDTNYQLWLDCESGDKKALGMMLAYNIEDVNLLEAVYIWIRGWIKNHPNIGLYLDIDYPTCRNCGCEDLRTSDKWYITGVNKFKAYQCTKCGATGRLLSETSKKQRNNTLRSLSY